MWHEVEQYLTRISTYPWWVVAVELLLIGVAVHGVIEFMRGTHGARLIKGTALFLVVAYVVIRLGGDRLVRVEYLYSRLLVFATFANSCGISAGTAAGSASAWARPGCSGRWATRCDERWTWFAGRRRIAQRTGSALVAIEREVGLGGAGGERDGAERRVDGGTAQHDFLAGVDPA